MQVIAFVTQKGGSGKSTLAFCCAVRAEQERKRVLILDMDPQATAEQWYMDREMETPRLAKIKASQLSEAVRAAAVEGYEFVLIDTPGRDEPANAAAIKAADFCIVPCRPTPGDMKATPPTIETINRLGKPAAFVLTQTPPRGVRVSEAERGLKMLGMVAPVRIVHRSAYQDAQGRGLGVTEYEPEGKAAEEVIALWKWVTRKLEKLNHEGKANGTGSSAVVDESVPGSRVG
jgi:chromosome partitioning protein